MKKTLNLFIYELDRIKNGFLLLVGAITVINFGAIILSYLSYMNSLKEFQIRTQGNSLDFLNEYGSLSALSGMYTGLINYGAVLGVVILVGYAMLIWYRDWIGKNSFSYRLMILPGSRTSVYLAKLFTIIFLMLALMTLQLFLLWAGDAFLGLLAPETLYEATTIAEAINQQEILQIIFPPTSLLDFILHYSFGFGILTVVYMMIIINFSFKKKGTIINLLLIFVGINIFVLLMRTVYEWLFPLEKIYIGIVGSLLIAVIAMSVTHFLMNKKLAI